MRILVTESLAESGLARLREVAAVDCLYDLTPQALIDCIGDYQALVVRSATKVTARVIEAGRQLKVIGRAGAGVDNIDVDAATDRGVVVVNVPEGNTIAAAEHTFGLLMSLARHIPQANNSLKGGEWKRSKFMGVELYGKVLGVVGLGRIGLEVARRARAFGMRVLAYDPYVPAERAEKLGIELWPLNDVLRQADFVTVHAPLTRETHGLIGKRELALMKPGARLVNAARGEIVSEKALYEALSSGHLGGAALDVFEEEPLTAHPLFELQNVIVTPHLGASTLEAQDYNSIQVAEQIIKVLQGEPILTAVNLPAVPPEEWQAIAPYSPLVDILGRIFAQAMPGRILSIEVLYAGEVANHPTALLTNTLLKGLFRCILEEPVNFINAPIVARKRGIRVTESKMKDGAYYPNLVTMQVETDQGKRSISGTVSPVGEVHIVEIDGYHVDFVPGEHMLLAWHIDKPGMIGRIGTLMGDNDINIAGMWVGRITKRGRAVMILQVDEEVNDAILDEVNQIEGILEARRVRLPRREP